MLLAPTPIISDHRFARLLRWAWLFASGAVAAFLAGPPEVLVAAAFYLTAHARFSGWTMRGVTGVATGFLLYFFSRFTYALGLSTTLPIALAAWAPTAVAARPINSSLTQFCRGTCFACASKA